MATRIEWADDVWNPTLGCSRVSPGCDRWYAIGVAHRAMQPAHRGLTFRIDNRTDWTGEIRLLPERLDTPLKVRKPTRWFVGSMSDLYHPHVPDEFHVQVFGVMMQASHHTFLVLTKRPGLMAQRVATFLGLETRDGYDKGGGIDPPSNVWLGTSIELNKYTFRADHLRATPAAVRWLSLEPLFGPLPSLDLTGIDWVVVGGESGPAHRAMDVAWLVDIADRCDAAGVPLFVKQDSHARSGQQGRLPDELWARKEYPACVA